MIMLLTWFSRFVVILSPNLFVINKVCSSNSVILSYIPSNVSTILDKFADSLWSLFNTTLASDSLRVIILPGSFSGTTTWFSWIGVPSIAASVTIFSV